MKNHTSTNIELVLQTITILQEMSKIELISITQLSKNTGISTTKVYRILQTLVSIDYAYQDQYECYGLTLKIVNLSTTLLSHFEITQKSQPYLKELSRITEETVHLAQAQQDHIIYVAKVDSPHALRIHSYIGNTAPIYCTSLGKAIFAHYPQHFVEKIVSTIDWIQYTENTIIDPSKFLQELELVKQQSYAEDRAEHVEHMHCYGAPIFDYTGACIAAISVSIPIMRMTENKGKDTIAALLSTSQQISQLFGFVSS